MSDPVIGQLLALVSAVCFGASSVFISRGATGKGDRGVIFSALVTLVFSGALWLIIDRGQLPAQSNRDLWLGLFWFSLAGIFSVVMGRTLIYASIRKLGVTRGSAVKKITPFFSVLFAFVILDETLNAVNWTGVAGVALAFAILIRKSFQRLPPEERNEIPPAIDYSWGLGGAVVYGMSYVSRKLGLIYLASPAFGTMISALIGFATFLIAAIFSERYRDNLRNLFRNLNRWLVLAAIAISCGQILIFTALYYEDVSIVIMINALDVFFASFLSVVIFRTEKRPDLNTYVAAVIAFVSIVLISQ